MQKLLMATVLLIVAPVACPAQITFTEYPIPTSGSKPSGIAAGPDGNLWFTEANANQIGKITPTGVVTEYPVPSASYPDGITTGPDGNLWFGERERASGVLGKIGKITTAGVITEYLIPSGRGSDWVSAGPDGNIWFTEPTANNIGKITTAGVITEYPVPTANSGLQSITTGPDGNLWFTETSANQIGKITTAGVITEYLIPTGGNNNAFGITSGPDGNLWFVEFAASKIGKITTAGVITEFSIPTAGGPVGITRGPDGNLWFTEQNANNIGKITTAGVITEYPVPTANSEPEWITTGPDGNLWFTEFKANQIGKVSLNAVSFQCTGTVVAQKWTGGGEIPVTPIMGSASFGLSVSSDVAGNVKGQLEYIDHVNRLDAHSIVISHLVSTDPSNKKACFDGTVSETVNGSSSQGPCHFIVNVGDDTQSGSKDFFSINIKAENGCMAETQSSTVTHGNITQH
jgi:streptogramin lyase